MENQQNQEARQSSSAPRQEGNKSGAGRSSHGRNRHHRRPQQPKKPAGEGSEVKSQETAREEGTAHRGEKGAAQNAQKHQSNHNNNNNSNNHNKNGGDRSRSQGRRGRGGKGGNAQKEQNVTPNQPEANESRNRAPRENPVVDSDAFLSRSLFDSNDPFREDSFLPIHEEHKPDPEAEKYAAAILDAEGPLLGRGVPEPTENTEDTESAQTQPVGEGEAAEDETPVEIVGIRFRRTGKVYFFAPGNCKLRAGSYAVVETARGLEYGEVCRANTTVPQKQIVPPLRPVIRAATKDDMQHYEENKQRENDAFRICQEKIAAHGLDMKLVEAEYTFDNTKLLFYFTSAGRVDFRELVKDLAGVFRTRIELRQIGIRDEAKLLGGLGTCGRPLCCASFLADFVQVSIKMAKEQSLSLNSTKISGCCGRLMCCLRYESDTYEEEIRRTPSVGSLLQTPDGQGTVISCNPLRGTVRVRLGTEEGTLKEFHRASVQVLKRGNHNDEE